MKKVFKNACVTGAGNGIGRSIAISLNKEGYNVVCADIDLKALNETLKQMSNKKCLKIKIKCNVSILKDIDKMIAKTVKELGSLDIMVNNAGVTKSLSLFDLDEKHWEWMNNINAKGTFFCLQKSAKQMIKQGHGGRIINMSSVGAKGFVDVSNAIYAGTKGAILSMTKTSSQELGEHNINVNSICPAPTYTDIVKKLVEKRAKEKKISKQKMIEYYMRNVPLGRFNETEDISSMVLFLCSEGARNITGQSFNIDGGLIPS
jgi:NAD(P)-dependent dehydrogenase (short-subunit alcohol dehydrogenase family)